MLVADVYLCDMPTHPTGAASHKTAHELATTRLETDTSSANILVFQQMLKPKECDKRTTYL